MKRWVCVLIPVLLLTILIVWRVGEKRAEGVGQMNQRAARMKMAPVVSVASVQVRDVSHTFEATGTIEAPLNVKIAPKVTGRIDRLDVREGDRVRKGQVLVRIDPSQVEANVQQAMANLAEAQYRLAQAQINQGPNNMSVSTQIRQQKAGFASSTADYNQTKENYQAQLASARANVTDAEARVENAKAGLNGAKANLENATAKCNRILDLYKQGFIAAQDVDDAKAAVTVQQSSVTIAQGQLNSALAQKVAAQEQANIVKTKGKADIEASKAKMDQSEASLDYAKANAVQKPAYAQSLAALRSSVAAARAALTNAQAQRADTVLTSPLDGFVTGRYFDPGAVATSGQPIIAVQFIKNVWVTIAVPDEVSTKIHMGEEAEVRLDAVPNRIFTGTVVQINPSADLQSRQFTVRVILDNRSGMFRPGMFARVSIQTDISKNATVVPREAVQRDKFGQFVMVVDRGNKASRRPVSPGIDDPGFIAIDHGVQPGEKVIIMSAFPVRDGQKVMAGGRKGKAKMDGPPTPAARGERP